MVNSLLNSITISKIILQILSDTFNLKVLYQVFYN